MDNLTALDVPLNLESSLMGTSANERFFSNSFTIISAWKKNLKIHILYF